MSSPKHPLRVAILGAGQMARHHARALYRIDVPHEIVAVFDPDEGTREELLGLCPTAKGAAEAHTASLRGAVDLVHVCTPPATHAPLARRALEAGCHVYVEKPFALTRAEASEILSLARQRDLSVCAGHQLLFEWPTRMLLEVRGNLGDLSHVESYFAFRPSRAGISADEQLKDVLPHPVYLLLRILELAAPEAEPRVEAVRVGTDGTVHALIASGGVVGSLVVTLTGRPVESYLKVVGANGTVTADYVRGIVLRAIGPGSSAIDKAFQPFRTARQLTAGTVRSLGRRFLRRQRSYPGLAEIFQAFYRSVVQDEPAPLSDDHILHTVALAEKIGDRIGGAEERMVQPMSAPSVTNLLESAPPHRKNAVQEGVVVTGGTGFLGSAVVRRLVAEGVPVRVLSRRVPAPWERIAGADYRAVDLGAGCPPSPLEGYSGVLHCAAETRGGWEDHQRNSIDATGALMRASAAAGVSRFLHVSSVAVLAAPSRGEAVREGSSLDPEDRRAGPYVWGKLNSERLAAKLAGELGVSIKIVRPGPIVDYRAFEPPGRLGRRLGNLFVAVGPASETLGVVDLTFAARTLAWMIRHFENAPEELNLLSPELPTRRELVQRLRAGNPDLRVVWLPRMALAPLSAAAVLAQKALRPGSEPLRLSRAFASERYDTHRVQALEARIKSDSPPQSTSIPSAARSGN